MRTEHRRPARQPDQVRSLIHNLPLNPPGTRASSLFPFAAAKCIPHFHSEVQHRPFPQRARSPGAEDGSVMANPGPGAPEIRARGDRSPVETQRSRALRTVQAAPRGRRRPAGRREGGARPRSAGRRRPFLSPDQSLRNAVRDGSGQGGRAFRNASAGAVQPSASHVPGTGNEPRGGCGKFWRGFLWTSHLL